MITENLSTLKIHKLTKEQYEREVSAGRIDENALYLTPDEEIDLSEYATVEQLNGKADKVHPHSINEIDNLQSSLDGILEESKGYTDTKTSGLASSSSVDEKISAHDSATDAHSDIRGLIGDLEQNKANTTHSHVISDVTDLQDSLNQISEGAKGYTDLALEGKANTTHSHAISDVNGLTDELNNVNESITNITNGNTTVKKAEHAGTADEAAHSTSADKATTATTADSATTAESATKATQDASGNVITSTYETKTDAIAKLNEAKTYADGKVEGLASTTVVDNKISAHNTSDSAHSDIRGLVSELSTKLNKFLNVSGDEVDELSDILTMIDNNRGTLESLTTSKVNVDDIINNLTTNSSDKVLSAAQGVAIKSLIDTLQGELNKHSFKYAGSSSEGGSANSAVKLETARTISLTGDVSGSVSFDGSTDASISVVVADDSHNHIIDNVDGLKVELDGKQPTITGGASTITNSNLTASRALVSDANGKVAVSDVTSTELGYLDGVTSNIQTQLNKKANDFSIELYNGTGGNPKPVKFMTVNYSTCGSENGVAIKLGMVSGHGNGSSYAFLQDAIIKVGYTGNVEVDNFKYYGAATTLDGARQFGDIFWVIDTTNKIVDFYVLMGQYARIQMTPWKRVTYSTGGTITQYTSCAVYSSGDKVWANNSDIALMSDINSHNQAASTITAGTFAGQVVANSSGQAVGTSLLRNSKLVSADTNPSVNGEICWTYK